MQSHTFICSLLALLLTSLCSCTRDRYHVAVSVYHYNDWNMQLTKDLEREANSHPEIQLDMHLCQHGPQEQIDDIHRFIRQRADVILLATDEGLILGPSIDEAAAAGIPIILIDNEIDSVNYTASVCTDNHDIGLRAGRYAALTLGGRGKVLELQGVRGSSAASDRHDGFYEIMREYPDIVTLHSSYTDWTYEAAFPLVDSLLYLHPDIDMIAAQNDPMALAAYDACIKHQLPKLPLIIGVDGLSGEGHGIQSVLQGHQAATCINPTGGPEAIQLALDILNHRPYQRVTKLPTQLVDQNNVSLVLEQANQIAQLNARIEDVNGRLGRYFHRSNLLQLLIIFALLLICMGTGFILYVIRSSHQKSALRQKVVESTQAKLTFFTNVSHSFRTPLTLIADPIRQLQAQHDTTPDQLHLLEIVSRNTQSLLQLVDKVLNVLQDDLLRDGAHLDAIAQQSVHATTPASSFRQRQISTDPIITTEESRKTVLIIDDNPDIRQYLSTILTNHHFLVLTAPNGEEGLQVAQKNIPDLIISDVMMPVMDGLECCRLLKAGQTTSHIPVMLLTAYALDDQRIQGYQSGADAYITKPFNTDVLCARIDNLISSRKRIDTRRDRYAEMERAEFSPIDRGLINHFHSFVTENLSNTDLGIQQLCDEFNMSHVQLYRKCKSITGQSPVEIVRIIRLKAATQMLQSTTKTISEIAYDTGFTSPSYFAKCYKDQYGISPTDAREMGAKL